MNNIQDFEVWGRRTTMDSKEAVKFARELIDAGHAFFADKLVDRFVVQPEITIQQDHDTAVIHVVYHASGKFRVEEPGDPVIVEL